MTSHVFQPGDDRLLDILPGGYHSLAMRRLHVAADRRGVGWVSATICSHPDGTSEEECPTCETWARYLSLAFAEADGADVSQERQPQSERPEDVHLWIGLESVHGDSRDLELVRLDFDEAVNSDTVDGPDNGSARGA